MGGVEFNGEMYHDDRMFVLSIARCTIALVDDDILETTIYHDKTPESYKWCLVTYRNTKRYPPVRVDHFDSYESAVDYMKKTEPTVPLISLGGRSPKAPLPYAEFVKWKERNSFAEYEYKKLFIEGGTNHGETILSRRR